MDSPKMNYSIKSIVQGISMVLAPMMIVLFSRSAQGQEPREIEQIRKTYNQKVDFDNFELDLSRMVPGRGEKRSTLSFQYLDCHYMDCSEYGISDKINGKVLRRVIAKIHIDLEDRTAEYLYNEYGQLIFCFLRISSPKYYEDTGRECGQERYYFHQQELIRLKIDPCPPTEGESFEPLQKDAGITKGEEQAVLAVQRKAMEYKSLFDQISGI